MVGETGALVGIIFVVLVAIIAVGMWITERRNRRKLEEKWERETREARARVEEREKQNRSA